MMSAYVGRGTDLRKKIVLRIMQRLAARLGRVEESASADAAFIDFASRVDRLLGDEMIAVGRDARHADREPILPYVVILPAANPDNDIAAPAATGSLVAARIRKQRPGPKPEDHTKFYRIIIEALGYSGGPSGGGPEILLDDDSLRKIVAAADSKGITPPGRRRSEYTTKPPYSSWAVCLAESKEACRKAIRNRIKWAMRRL
jgi:hypothetical protein